MHAPDEPTGNMEAKTIACPKCHQRLSFEGFIITTHEDETWSCDPSVDCSWDCGAVFFITHSQVEWIRK